MFCRMIIEVDELRVRCLESDFAWVEWLDKVVEDVTSGFIQGIDV